MFRPVSGRPYSATVSRTRSGKGRQDRLARRAGVEFAASLHVCPGPDRTLSTLRVQVDPLAASSTCRGELQLYQCNDSWAGNDDPEPF